MTRGFRAVVRHRKSGELEVRLHRWQDGRWRYCGSAYGDEITYNPVGSMLQVRNNGVPHTVILDVEEMEEAE